MGAFRYDWLMITDPGDLPTGTVKVCGTVNESWMADNTDGLMSNFVSFSGANPYSTTADRAVTAEELASNPTIIGNLIEVGDTAFVGVNGDGASVILTAPESGGVITRIKFRGYITGNNGEFTLFKSDKLDGLYEEVITSKRRIGSVAGWADNHFYWDYEAADITNACYLRITFPTEGYPKLGAFEYDYKCDPNAENVRHEFYTYADILGGQSALHVSENLTLPGDIVVQDQLYNIIWSASEETLLAPDGTVTCGSETRNVTLNARVTNASTGNYVYSRDYYLIIASAGSEFILGEGFEDVTEPRDLMGYKNWTYTAAEGMTARIDVDSLNGAADFSAANKAAILSRDRVSEVDSCTASFDAINAGKVEFSFKHMVEKINNESRINFAGLDIYMRASGVYAYVSGMTAFVESHQMWEVNKWHEYRMILDMDARTIDIYYNDEKVSDKPIILPDVTYVCSAFSFGTKRQTYDVVMPILMTYV